MDLNEMLTHLYDLDRSELRRLAAEALLISDGPDAPENIISQDPGTSVEVYLIGLRTSKATDPNNPNNPSLTRVDFDLTVNLEN